MERLLCNAMILKVMYKYLFSLGTRLGTHKMRL